MMSYDKYERGRQHLNGGHQRITYKTKKKLIIISIPFRTFLLAYFRISGTGIRTFFHVSLQCPLLIAAHVFGKKVPLIVFRYNVYQKPLSVVHIFSFTIVIYLKKFIWIKSFNIKQCSPRLFLTLASPLLP